MNILNLTFVSLFGSGFTPCRVSCGFIPPGIDLENTRLQISRKAKLFLTNGRYWILVSGPNAPGSKWFHYQLSLCAGC